MFRQGEAAKQSFFSGRIIKKGGGTTKQKIRKTKFSYSILSRVVEFLSIKVLLNRRIEGGKFFFFT